MKRFSCKQCYRSKVTTKSHWKMMPTAPTAITRGPTNKHKGHQQPPHIKHSVTGKRHCDHYMITLSHRVSLLCRFVNITRHISMMSWKVKFVLTSKFQNMTRKMDELPPQISGRCVRCYYNQQDPHRNETKLSLRATCFTHQDNLTVSVARC